MHSSPAGSATRSSHFSATFITQRFALALLTDGERPSQSSSLSGSQPRGGRGNRGDDLFQSEEILRVTSSNVNAQVGVEIGSGTALATSPIWAVSGSALVNVEVQDFGNLLRLPLLSHALLNWNVSGRGGNDGDLFSPFRPVVAASAGVRGAVVNVSVTAIQCLDRCVGELLPRRTPVREAGAIAAKSAISSEAPAETAASPAASRVQSRQRSKRYVIENFTDRTFWFGQVSTTETLLLRAGEDRCYRWRKIPTPIQGEGGGSGRGSRLGLMLRLALHHDPDSSFGAWTEPFLADQAGTFMVCT